MEIIYGGLDGGVPNSVFNKINRAFLLNSVFDSMYYSLIVKK